MSEITVGQMEEGLEALRRDQEPKVGERWVMKMEGVRGFFHVDVIAEMFILGSKKLLLNRQPAEGPGDGYPNLMLVGAGSDNLFFDKPCVPNRPRSEGGWLQEAFRVRLVERYQPPTERWSFEVEWKSEKEPERKVYCWDSKEEAEQQITLMKKNNHNFTRIRGPFLMREVR